MMHVLGKDKFIESENYPRTCNKSSPFKLISQLGWSFKIE